MLLAPENGSRIPTGSCVQVAQKAPNKRALYSEPVRDFRE